MAASSAARTEPVVRKRNRRRKYSAAPLVMGEIDASSLSPAMLAITPKQRRFVLELRYGPAGYGSEVRAARAAGFGTPTSSDNAMKVEAHRTLHHPKVQEALREVGGKIIRAEAFQSIKNTARIANDIQHKDCLKANLALMDRGGFAVETHHHVTVSHIDHDAEAVGELRALLDMGVAKEKLEELFGRNGLTRYERLLAIEDGKRAEAAKVIEHND